MPPSRPSSPGPTTQQPHDAVRRLAAAVTVALSVFFVTLVICGDLRALGSSGSSGSSSSGWRGLGPLRALPFVARVDNMLPPTPHGHHAIIIPYRDRAYHLARFKEHMGPYLQRNFPNDTFSLWIVEQGDDRLFNRAWLGNVGIAEALKAENLTQCIIFHDVDLVPERDGVPYNQCRLPTQLGSELEHHNWGVPYPKSFGGVASMHMQHWRRVNGFSNDYWGWGKEDDDLYERVRINGLLDRGKVHRPPKGHGRFRTISQSAEHHHNQVGKKEIEESVKRLEQMKRGSKRWRTDGLSNVHYTVLERSLDASLPRFAAVHHIKCRM